MGKADLTYKICIFGESGVGKTTLANHFITGKFETDLKTTLGAQIHVKYMKIMDYIVLLQIWDFGGEEQFRFLLPSYARGSSGGIFMYDISEPSSLDNIDDWIHTFTKGLPDEDKEIPVLLVGGKSDLVEKRFGAVQEAIQLSNKRDFMGYIECSSKTGENIARLFEILVKKIIVDSIHL